MDDPFDAPRPDSTRSVPFEVRASDDADGLTLSGYAAVFDSPTDIRDWEGEYEETIARGAFAKTIKERSPVLQFDHGSHPLLGSIPLGAITKLREDQHGLYVEARLHDNWLTEPVRDAIASGAVHGMSFRFQVIKDTWDQGGDKPKRTINEVKLLELGPVVFPAYRDTTVGVRSLLSQLDDDGVRALAAELANHLGTPTSAQANADQEPPSTEPASPTAPLGLNHGERARVLRSLQLPTEKP